MSKSQYITYCKELEDAQNAGRKKCSLEASAFNWILENVPENGKILELGSGKSSQIFSELYKIDSIEDNQRFIGKYSKVNYIPAKIVDYGKYYWYDATAIKKKLGKKYDLIIVDGPTDKTGREGFILNFNLFEKYDCPILLDETDRKTEKKMLECFLSSGFETIHVGKKFYIIKKRKNFSGFDPKQLAELTNNKKILIVQVENKILEFAKGKRDFDLCIVYTGNDSEFAKEVKKHCEYFITEHGTKEHNYKKALEEIPKISKYEKIEFG